MNACFVKFLEKYAKIIDFSNFLKKYFENFRKISRFVFFVQTREKLTTPIEVHPQKCFPRTKVLAKPNTLVLLFGIMCLRFFSYPKANQKTSNNLLRHIPIISNGQFFLNQYHMISFPALRKLRGTLNVEDELKELEGDESSSPAEDTWTLFRVLKAKELWLPLTLACSANFVQQITSLDEVIFHAGQLFQKWNLGDYFVTWSLMVISIINALASALAVC